MPIVKSKIEPNAQTHTFMQMWDHQDVERELDAHWERVKDLLHPELVKKAMKGYRTLKRERVVKAAGGVEVFYRQALIKLMNDDLASSERQALAYNEINVRKDDSHYHIVASIYLEPEVTWKKKPGIDEEIIVKIPKVADDIIERVVDDEIKRVCASHTVLVPRLPEEPAQEGDVVVVHCVTHVDGEIWLPGTFDNNKWLVQESAFKAKEMYQAIKNAKTNETRKIAFTLGDNAGDKAGKEAIASVTTVQVLIRNEPEINDDLAVSAGRENLVAWKKELTEHFTRVLQEEREALIMHNATAALVNPEVVDVEPVPMAWIIAKAQELYAQRRKMFETEKELIAAFNGATTFSDEPVVDRDSLLRYLGEHIGQGLVNDLVARSWGRLKGVEGDTNLDNLVPYAEAARRELLNTIKLEEV